MKKIPIIITVLLLTPVLFVLGFNYKSTIEPEGYYQVYLDDEIIGTIKSKKELEKYIDTEGESIKKKYNVKTVYAPNGLEIKKILTYDKKIDEVKDIYKRIKEERPFTVKGYQITIKEEAESTEETEEQKEIIKKFYILDEKIFENAVENTIKMFIGKERYEQYKEETQEQIETTGRYIENIYIEGNKTIKEMKIPVTENIYIDETELTKYLVFGENNQTKEYTVQLGDTIEKVAFNNQISIEEFLISNPDFTSSNNLLYPNQIVTIGITDPQIKVVTEEHVVEDKESSYKTEIKYDEELLIGEEKITQNGENGLERISQNVKSVNGTIVFVDPKGKEVLKEPINEILVKGSHYIPHVGSLTSWGWPTESGWTITSYYAWRINPISGQRELHDALDIAGTGYGSPIYAANNGTVVKASYTSINGNYVVINHNNGYYTYYGHMSRILVKEGQVVARGTEIGKVGSTGWATGPHVHFGIWKGYPYYGGRSYNPLNFY